MKKLLLSLTVITILFAGCKKDDPTSKEIKVVTSGASYSVTITNSESLSDVLLDKPNQTGTNTYSLETAKSVNVNFVNTGSLTFKIYINNELKHDKTRGSGSEVISVN